MNGSLQYLYDRLNLWPDRPAALTLGQPVGSANGFFIEPVAGKAFDEELAYRLYDVTMRLRPDGDDDMLACAALADSLVEYACSGGAEVAVSPERTVSVSVRRTDGSRDFSVCLSCRGESESSGETSASELLPELRLNIGGRSVNIGGSSVFSLVSVKGLESAEYFASLSPNGAADGSFIRGLSTPERIIEFTLSFAADNSTQSRREFLISALAPDTLGTLFVRRGGLRRKISAAVKSVKYEACTSARRVRTIVALICPNPYFTDELPHIYSIRRSVPLLTFPFNSIAGVGITASLIRTNYSVTICNDGHCDAGFTAGLRSLSGGTVNPSLTCGDKLIRLLDSSVAGDFYSVSTVEGDKRIEKNGESFYAFDRHSVFFTLDKGVNTINVDADSGEDATEAVISCEFRYFGI